MKSTWCRIGIARERSVRKTAEALSAEIRSGSSAS
jgi:hypothetical protein